MWGCLAGGRAGMLLGRAGMRAPGAAAWPPSPAGRRVARLSLTPILPPLPPPLHSSLRTPSPSTPPEQSHAPFYFLLARLGLARVVTGALQLEVRAEGRATRSGGGQAAGFWRPAAAALPGAPALPRRLRQPS